MASAINSDWPELPYSAWQDTCTTLHLWTQIVGKIRLTKTPWLNHGWHVPLYVTARGLGTSPIPHGTRIFEMEFDFIDHVLTIDVSDGQRKRLSLRPQSVATFHRLTLQALAELGVPARISDFPSEIPNAIPFSKDDTHTNYDGEYAQRFWRVLVQVDRVFKQFRTSFLGKTSPVHFFWGSFDLAVTRFSGRKAPLYGGAVPGLAPAVMQEAYSHEVSSAGFWPGGSGVDQPCFYSYAYPEPPGFRAMKVRPSQAAFSEQLSLYLLPYDAVRTASDPDAALLDFMQSTYEAAALTAEWDRSLECQPGSPGVPRTL